MTTYRLRGGPADGGLVETDAHGPPKRIRVPLRSPVWLVGWPTWEVVAWGSVNRATVEYEWKGEFYRYANVFTSAAT